MIPIITENTTLPLRWRILQQVYWRTENADFLAKAIASILPEQASSKLAKALSNATEFEEVKELILTHPEWLPMEAYMSRHYSFRIQPKITVGSVVDCFAARLDTPGPRAILIYLASPYDNPFLPSGDAQPYLNEVIATLFAHAFVLRRNLPSTHPLAPQTLFAEEAAHWKYIPSRYTGIEAYVIAGRRPHYQGNAIKARNSYVKYVNASIFPVDEFRLCSFDMISYDRILDVASRKHIESKDIQ